MGPRRQQKRKRKLARSDDEPSVFIHCHGTQYDVDRSKLTRTEYLEMLATPKGYRWAGIGTLELEVRPRRKKPGTKRRKVADRPEDEEDDDEFTKDIWGVMNPSIADRLKNFLVCEFGMPEKEADNFLNNRCTKPQQPKFCMTEHIPICDLETRNKWVKEFSIVFSKRVEQYIVSLLMTRRTPDVTRVAERILEQLCDLTGEKTTLQNPKTKMQKVMVLVAERVALWVLELMKGIIKSPKPCLETDGKPSDVEDEGLREADEGEEEVGDEKEDEVKPAPPKKEKKPKSEKPKKDEENPDEEKPDEEKPDEERPDEENPDEEKPDEEKPDEERPDEEKPDEEKPDEEKPDEQKTDESKPDEPMSDEEKPDEEKPDEEKPDEQKPDEPKPDEPKPESKESESVTGSETKSKESEDTGEPEIKEKPTDAEPDEDPTNSETEPETPIKTDEVPPETFKPDESTKEPRDSTEGVTEPSETPEEVPESDNETEEPKKSDKDSEDPKQPSDTLEDTKDSSEKIEETTLDNKSDESMEPEKTPEDLDKPLESDEKIEETPEQPEEEPMGSIESSKEPVEVVEPSEKSLEPTEQPKEPDETPEVPTEPDRASEELKKSGEKLDESYKSAGESEKIPQVDIFDIIKEDIDDTIKHQPTDRQKEIRDAIERRINEIGKGISGISPEDIDDTASRVAHWIDQIMGTSSSLKEIHCTAGPAFGVKLKTSSTLDVQKLSCDAVRETTAQVRGIDTSPRPRIVPAYENPTNLAQELIDWTANVANVAEEWGKWLDSTLTDAEKQIAENKKGSPEVRKNWKQWRDNAQDKSLKWRSEQNKINNEANIWAKNLNDVPKLATETEVRSTNFT